jgi:hypothetical protein
MLHLRGYGLGFPRLDISSRLPAHVSEQTRRPEEVRPPAREYAALAAGSFAQMPIVPNAALFAACTHVQVDRCAGDTADNWVHPTQER